MQALNFSIMKKQINYRWLTAVISLFLAGQVTAQNTFKELSPVTVTSTATMNEKVKKVFEQEYKDARITSWYKTDKNTLIRFVLNDIVQHILYNERGRQIYHLSYYEEKNMPADVVKLIRHSYPGYTISQAVNVKQDNRDIWVVTAEDQTTYYFIRTEDGETELVKTMEKQ